MNKEKQKALEAAGWRIGDAGEFLGLSIEEREIVELRAMVGRKVRQLRESQNLTQFQLAAKIKSSQSRIAKIEAAAPDVSLDLMFRGFFAAGGKLTDLTAPLGRPKVPPDQRGQPAAAKTKPRKSGRGVVGSETEFS